MDFWTDGTIPWVNSGAVNQILIKTPSTFITKSALSSSSAKWIPKGALLIALAGQGKTKGMVAQTDIRVTCNQSMAAICPAKAIESRFLLHWLHSQYGNIRGLAGDEQRDGLNLEMIGSILCPLPPLDEQRTLAAFLDCETSRIDALIEKKQKQIELLQEKRIALISHAVTKGLDPNVNMKDPGVEWLGPVPEGWSISKLGFHASVKARLGWKGLKADEYVDEGFIFLSTPNIKNRHIDFDAVNYITKERYLESPEIMLEVGDVLIAKDGSTLGTTNIVRDLPAPATVNSSIAVLRPKSNLHSNFLYWIMVCPYTQSIIQQVKDGQGVPHLFQADLRQFWIWLPSYEEQRTIAAYLNRETARIDALIEKVEKSLVLLREWRTSLISAAVTGKIDIRKEAA